MERNGAVRYLEKETSHVWLCIKNDLQKPIMYFTCCILGYSACDIHVRKVLCKDYQIHLHLYIFMFVEFYPTPNCYRDWNPLLGYDLYQFLILKRFSLASLFHLFEMVNAVKVSRKFTCIRIGCKQHDDAKYALSNKCEY